MSAVQDFIAKNHDRYEEELKALLRIPSVSADSKHQTDVRRACEFVIEKMKTAGLKTEIIETPGHPMAYGEWLEAKGAPTVLVYGHYDVQPPDPLDLWTSGPFEPTVRNGNIYARGATDDKGQMYVYIKAIEAWLETEGKLPVNVKVLIEGEEEVGSKNISEYLPAHREKLKADYVAISDCCMFAPDTPAITYGLKGLAYFELFVQGPDRDLHSGSFGGSVQNPCNALCEMIAALKDKDGRIRVPGFYDDVVDPTPAEREQFRKLQFTEDHYQKEVGVKECFGEKDYSTLERRWVRPTCDVNGMWGGYQGEGAKTVLPAKAGAKFSFRLVPNQNPQTIAASLKSYLMSICPPGVEFELKPHHGGEPVVVGLDSPGIRAASAALEKAYGKKPVFIREGGSIPIVTTFKRALGIDSLLIGFGLNDDNTHSPNEKMCLKDYHRGIQTAAHLFAELAVAQRQ